MTPNERIRYFRKEILHLSQTDFGRLLGIQQRTVCNLEKREKIPEHRIEQLCRTFRLNERWLRDGSGPVFQTGEEADCTLPAEIAERFSVYLCLPGRTREIRLIRVNQYCFVKKKTGGEARDRRIFRDGRPD